MTIDEIKRLLSRGDRFNICQLERAMNDRGTAITRHQLHRWFSASSTPTVDRVEHLARAAEVDRAYLMVEGR